MSHISLYKNAMTTKPNGEVDINDFLEGVRTGTWQDPILALRAFTDKKMKDEAKKKIDAVTIAGLFSERNDNALIEHSGFMAVDIDNCDVQKLKEQVKSDNYVYAAFQSVGGYGVCLIVRIDPKKHRESYDGFSKYMFDTYDYIVDPTGVNVSRLRFVSYDPDLHLNLDAKVFRQYPTSKPPKKVDKVLYAKDDFDALIEDIVSRRMNLCENYYEWLRIGFALRHQFGEAGRSYFHLVSQFSSKYDSTKCDRQYDSCLKHSGTKLATLGTFIYYCKQAGLSYYSERTHTIINAASQGKKAGLSAETVAENLMKFNGISDSVDVVKEAMDNNIEAENHSEIEELELYIRHTYELRRNLVTRFIENRGVKMEPTDMNTVYIRAKKVFPKLDFTLMERLINSHFIQDYNPITDFFKENESIRPEGCIDELLASVTCQDPNYLKHFGTKWLVSIVASAFGNKSNLCLVFTGAQNTGKSEFFRRLLPEKLRPYFAESQLDRGTDDHILMTQKLIIMDDEMGGKNKKESKDLKHLLDKPVWTLREPYGRSNVDLKRIAVLCGTTNEDNILNDPTGNRRIIPIKVNYIDHARYNSVDKEELFMEAYHLWKEGYNPELTRHDIEYLNSFDQEFYENSLEGELLSKFYAASDANKPNAELMTASEIKVEIEKMTNQRLNLYKLGRELKRMGYKQVVKSKNGQSGRFYYVTSNLYQKSVMIADGLPF